MSELQYMPQLNVDYFKSLNSSAGIEIENAIKISLMMVTGFRDILDDLNFDEEKLRNLQFNLDDNYEVVEEIYHNTKNSKTKKVLDELLTQMAKLEMEIGDLILEHRHAS
jgi:dephospho-CoA kinase